MQPGASCALRSSSSCGRARPPRRRCTSSADEEGSISLRILHISDLHFSAEGVKRRYPDGRDEFDRAKAFIQQIAQLSGREPIHAVLVSGDLVNDGANSAEFEKARDFLEDLRSKLGLDHSMVCVVPGNHDVDWTNDLRRPERFRRFSQAMGQFVTPCFTGDVPHSRFVTLSHSKRRGARVELLLLISPLFSGEPAPPDPKLEKKVEDELAGESDADRERVRESFRLHRAPLDVAAIGSHQRGQIDGLAEEGEHVRIAMLHHHLLPHPEVDSGPYAAVIDAGPVIDSMLPRFDLALTGHKHRRRLVQLHKGSEYLDVYSGPSAFHGYADAGATSGFTIIDVHGTTGAYYATLHYYETERMEPVERPQHLVRRGRLRQEIKDLCIHVSPEVQESQLLPVLDPVSRTLRLPRSAVPKPLFEQAWEQVINDLRDIQQGTLLFRPPHVYSNWVALLELAGRRRNDGAKLRLVSDGDLEFFRISERAESDPHYYEAPVRSYEGGSKHRLIILNRDRLGVREIRLASAQINSMVEAKIQVRVIWSERLPDEVWRDFGIIGDLAVSRFVNMGDQARTLKESFGNHHLQAANEHWRRLEQLALWNSGNPEHPPIDRWLSAEVEARGPRPGGRRRRGPPSPAPPTDPS